MLLDLIGDVFFCIPYFCANMYRHLQKDAQIMLP